MDAAVLQDMLSRRGIKAVLAMLSNDIAANIVRDVPGKPDLSINGKVRYWKEVRRVLHRAITNLKG